eukprot:427398_1
MSDETLSLKVYVKNQEIIDTGTPQQSQPIHYNMKSGFVYRFDVNSTWLHSLCGQQKAQTIKTIVDHKGTLGVLITVAILCFLGLLYGFVLSPLPGAPLLLTIGHLIWLLWFLLKHSLLNKTAF